jgi:acid phosphatase (class A)
MTGKSLRLSLGPLVFLAASSMYGQAAAPAPSRRSSPPDSAVPSTLSSPPNSAAPTGYLKGGPTPDILLILPPPPVIGDQRDDLDRAIFKATRSQEGSARWKMAAGDDDYFIPAMLKDFSCSLGAAPNKNNAPRLSAMLTRIAQDSSDVAVGAKSKYARQRPFLVDEGKICVARGGYLETSFDYPSGHATEGWAIALVLAEMLPSRATEILARGRAYGDSRIFCGVHNASAVEAGRLVGASVVSAEHASIQFLKDWKAAQAELLALRKKNPYTSDTCTAEALSVAMSPYAAKPKEPQH